MPDLYPFRFHPIFRRALWGGRRLKDVLGKPIGEGNDYAESWEVVDRGGDQSVVQAGPLTGTTLAELLQERGAEILGRHASQRAFPLLFKFLDAHQRLSVQVHPSDAQAARLQLPDVGKTEAWVILHADPGSEIYAGLLAGIRRQVLEREIRAGAAARCLHRVEVRPGDCVLIPAGTVHALGAGLVVAEVQQPSDTTFRLFDWNRLGPDGKPRPLHVPQALEVIDYERGPVVPQTPQPTDRPHVQRLVACEQFVLDRWQFDRPQSLGGDDRFHLIATVEGAVTLPGDPLDTLRKGQTALLGASLGEVVLTPQGRSVILDMCLP